MATDLSSRIFTDGIGFQSVVEELGSVMWSLGQNRWVVALLLVVFAIPIVYGASRVTESKRWEEWSNALLNTRSWAYVDSYGTRIFAWGVEHRLFAAVLFAWVVVVLHVPLVPAEERFTVGAENFLAVLLTVVVALVSANYLVQFLRYGERRRIADVDEIQSAYDRTDAFLDVGSLESWPDEIDHPTVVPAVVEDARVVDVADVEIRFRDQYYEFHPDVEAIIEPEIDDLRDTFRQEGHYSGSLFRLERISGGTFYGEKTSFYRSFVTNFCPDLSLQSGKTLRRLTEPPLFDEGGLKPLSASPLSDHLGIACLVLTTDGTLLLARRGGDVAVDQFTTSLPVSGSASIAHSLASGDDPTLESFFYKEMAEEISVEREHVRGLQYFGTIRRMERLGKPDSIAIAVIESDAEWRNDSGEYTQLVEYELDLDDTLSDASSVRDPAVADEILDTLAGAASSPGRPSTGLLSAMYLLDDCTSVEPVFDE